VRWLRKVILSRLHKLEMPAIKLPRLQGIKFRDKLWKEGFTSSAETEMIPAINSDETEHGPVYSEERLIVRTFRSVK